MSIREMPDQGNHSVEEDAKETRKKNIGYLAPQYRDIWIHGCSEEPAALTPLFDEAKEAAKEIEQPCWPVKHAAIYYTYDGKCYNTGPWRMDCTQEVFEVMSNTLIDHMYKLGAYDMFYSGMLD